MKRLTLEETWTLCLKMWWWIAAQIKKNPDLDIDDDLKREWTIKYGYERANNGVLLNNCFFCEYDIRHRRKGAGCSSCPARKIDPSFACLGGDYDYDDNPLAFYAKLVELNKRRLSKKRKY